MVELGDFVSGEQRKLLLEIEVPAMAALGLAQVCELELQWVELATMDTHKVTIPVSVNVVPGDEAAGRMPNPAVRTERAFQQAQRDKQAATDALRAGDAPAAAAMYASAAEALGGYADDEMQAEADVLFDLAQRAQHDDASADREVQRGRPAPEEPAPGLINYLRALGLPQALRTRAQLALRRRADRLHPRRAEPRERSRKAASPSRSSSSATGTSSPRGCA